MFSDINELESEGILPTRWLQEAARDDVIFTEKYKIPEANFQPASLDLRLGDKAYRLRCSFLPDASTVMDKLPELAMESIDLRDGAILEKNRPYLIPLIEQLRLPQGIRAKTNPKSSTGRLDIFTRVISDRSHKFDEIGEGYDGQLFLEVVSRSFTIKVQTTLSLNQLRLIKGNPGCAEGELLRTHQEEPILLYPDGQTNSLLAPAEDNTVALSANLAGEMSGVGYRAKKNSSLLDLGRESYYDPSDYWEPVYADRARRLILRAGRVLFADFGRDREGPAGVRGGNDRLRSFERGT